ncbi:MAG: fibrobacter succinogenes major paralogous domain-containing protein [Bacteroidales bacterium]|nr:hypothetical protein [Bacteroidales bacterium]MDD2425368.1 fibrobacter succinogenes major paralogous domain-containing protein [Bacteroidales bacterium]MDD3988785.1 fibrobacter succinogenes major paralogous domain-containing protein [Bacteroidales bacterium]MDD4638890.1 fibrobacter succinogenes major paralogous domain-containing protein [Bacteroidales bacterium]
MSNFSRLSVAFTIILFTILATGCKKDDTQETSDSMTGSLSFEMPVYLLTGSTLTLEASGITAPETGITYKWVFTGFAPDSASGKSVTVVSPLEPGTYTVLLSAQAEGYYSKSSSITTIVIDPASQESFSGQVFGTNYITDPRDGRQYYFTEIGNLFWFSQNLNWEGTGRPYGNIDALSHIYGRLYSWQEATGGLSNPTGGAGSNGACPPGWRVPTNQDWEELARHLNSGSPLSFDNEWKGLGSKLTVEALLNGSKIWKYSPNNNKENLYHWNALPGGNVSGTLSSFSNLNNYGFWWSSSEATASTAPYRYIYFDSGDFSYNIANKTFFGASVRCVRSVNQ